MKSVWLSEEDKTLCAIIQSVTPDKTFEDLEAARGVRRKLKIADLGRTSTEGASQEVGEVYLELAEHAHATKQLKEFVESGKVMSSTSESILRYREHLETTKEVEAKPPALVKPAKGEAKKD